MIAWHVGKVASGYETRMAARCEDLGVESFCPMLKRKRRSPGSAARERIDEPALQGYLPIRASTVEAPETREALYREPHFYDFIREVNNEISEMIDSDLDPLRMLERVGEPVVFTSGPLFYFGEIVKIPYNNDHVNKSFWGMTGQVVNKRRGRYCLGGYDFPMEAWFSGVQLLRDSNGSG